MGWLVPNSGGTANSPACFLGPIHAFELEWPTNGTSQLIVTSWRSRMEYRAQPWVPVMKPFDCEPQATCAPGAIVSGGTFDHLAPSHETSPLWSLSLCHHSPWSSTWRIRLRVSLVRLWK